MGRGVVVGGKRAPVPRVRRRREASARAGPAAPSLPNPKRVCGDGGEPTPRRGVLRHHRVHPSLCRRGPRRIRARCEERRLWLHPPAHRRNPPQRCGHFEGGLPETRVPRCRDRLGRTPGPHLGPPVALPPAAHRHRDPARVRQRDGDPGDDRGVPELRGEGGNRHRVRPGHVHPQPRGCDRRVDSWGDPGEHLRFDASGPAHDHAHRRPRDRAGSLLPVDSHLGLGDPRGECRDASLDSFDETDADGCENGRDGLARRAPPDLSLISVGDHSRSMVARTRRARITGLGGIFFKAKDPKAMAEWYGRHLGMDIENSMVLFSWRGGKEGKVEGHTVWSIFPGDTKYFGEDGASFMINYRVKDLDGLLASLRREGVAVNRKVEDTPYGRFGWITDPEGNRIELWEPSKVNRQPEKAMRME